MGKIKKLPMGLEPTTHALRMRCATNCATEAALFVRLNCRTLDSISAKEKKINPFFEKIVNSENCYN